MTAETSADSSSCSLMRGLLTSISVSSIVSKTFLIAPMNGFM